MNKRFRMLMAMFALSLLPFALTEQLYAQDAAATDPEQAQDSAASDTQTEPPAEQTDGNADSPELAQTGDDDNGGSRFIPTEQLSQDLGASFPVDI